MSDRTIYAQLFELPEPWFVDQVTCDPSDRRIDARVTHASGIQWSCPECSHKGPVRDHSPERSWRHLDSCHFETYLHARIPRVSCPVHGVRQVAVPWAEPDSRFTRLFERRAAGILAECRVSETAVILGITWDEARGIQQRVRRPNRQSHRCREHQVQP